jgi:hypothetical protein
VVEPMLATATRNVPADEENWAAEDVTGSYPEVAVAPLDAMVSAAPDT